MFTQMRPRILGLVAGAALAVSACTTTSLTSPLYPAPGATGVTSDTPLTIQFSSPPQIGTSGFIRVFDTATGTLVDEIDMSVAPSPLPDGRFPPNTNQAAIFALGRGSEMSDYQVNTVGGVNFHFQPVITDGNAARIYLHNNKIKDGHSYRVTIDHDVFVTDNADKLSINADTWTFSTRANPPASEIDRIIVSADGTGDFSTVQGAIDFAPDAPEEPIEIFIRNGDYQEIVMVNNKTNLTIRGESRDGVTVHYANNSAFNPPRGGPSTRPAFSILNVTDVQLSNFTIENDFIGQAEALLVRGDRVVIDRMTLNGSGDAFTTRGSIYMVDSELTGDGDTILGYATLYCLRCTVKSRGPFTWTRTPEGQHGNVFIDSRFTYLDEPLPWTVSNAKPEGVKTRGVLARLPRNGPKSSQANFPHAEMVLIDSTLEGIPAIGWGPVEAQPALDWSGVRFMEFNSVDKNGATIDLTTRHGIVRQLALPADAALVDNYRDPAFVFDGWTPTIRG